MRTNTLSVIIPALNEAEAIAQVVKAVPRLELAKLGVETEVIVVDNGSTDGTGVLAQQAGACVIHEPRRGYGRAIKTGLEHAVGSLVLKVDADCTYPLHLAPHIVRLLFHEDLAFVTTNRFAHCEPGAMKLRNRLGNLILTGALRLLFRIPLRDSQSGMWAAKREALPPLESLPDDASFSQELKIGAIKIAGGRWREIPIQYSCRTGKPKLGTWKVGIANLLRLLHRSRRVQRRTI